MRVSVVIPAYNVEGYIRETLKSLSLQSQPAFEVVVVDDGSTDGTVEEIEDVVAECPLPRFQLLQQENAGVSVARNRGLSRTSGDYVLFLDGDDTVSPDLVRTLEDDATEWTEMPDMVCWRFLAQGGRGAELFQLRGWDAGVEPWSCALDTLRRILVTESQELWIGAIAFRRAFLVQHNLSFAPGLHSAQDREFIWKCMATAGSVRNVEAPLSTYVWRASSTTNSPGLKHFDGFVAYDRAARVLGSTLPGEYGDVIQAANARTVERFMGHFIIHCRSYVGGSQQLLHDIEQRCPGIVADAQAAIQRQKATMPVDYKARLFLLSPRVAGRYFESGLSQANPAGIHGFPIKVMRHARGRTLGRAVRARVRELRAEIALRRNVERLRREGPRHGALTALSEVWGNTAYSADLEFLKEAVERGRDAYAILECGSGLTTVSLGALGKEVWTLEHDPRWLARLLHVLKVTRISQVQVRHAPLTTYGDFDWYSIPGDLPGHFDLVICDGPPGRTRGGRSGLFRLMSGRIQAATVLLDDVHRPQEQELVKMLASEGWAFDIRGTGEKKYAVLQKRSDNDHYLSSACPQP